jgi:hypothetical protein
VLAGEVPRHALATHDWLAVPAGKVYAALNGSSRALPSGLKAARSKNNLSSSYSGFMVRLDQ